MDKYLNNKYGKMTVTSIVGKNKTGRKIYLLTCDCGNTRESVIGNVVHGTVKACHACTAERVSKQNSIKATKHGMSGSGLYQSWKCMKSRCKDKTHPLYSKLDIDYFEPWKDFEVFKDWALGNGWQEDLTIDRIDSSKGYYPDNCQWLTREENTARANRGRTPWNKQ